MKGREGKKKYNGHYTFSCVWLSLQSHAEILKQCHFITRKARSMNETATERQKHTRLTSMFSEVQCQHRLLLCPYLINTPVLERERVFQNGDVSTIHHMFNVASMVKVKWSMVWGARWPRLQPPLPISA